MPLVLVSLRPEAYPGLRKFVHNNIMEALPSDLILIYICTGTVGSVYQNRFWPYCFK